MALKRLGCRRILVRLTHTDAAPALGQPFAANLPTANQRSAKARCSLPGQTVPSQEGAYTASVRTRGIQTAPFAKRRILAHNGFRSDCLRGFDHFPKMGRDRAGFQSSSRRVPMPRDSTRIALVIQASAPIRLPLRNTAPQGGALAEREGTHTEYRGGIEGQRSKLEPVLLSKVR